MAKDKTSNIKIGQDVYKSIFDSSSDILVLIDRKGTILNVNKRVLEVSGHRKSAVVGRNISSLAGIFTPKSVVLMTANFARRLMGKNVAKYEVEGRTKQGEPLYFEISAIPIRDKKDKSPIGELAVLHDITARKIAEKEKEATAARFRLLAEKIPDGVMLIESDRIIWTNSAVGDIFEKLRHGMTGRSFKAMLPAGKDKIEKTLNDVLCGKIETATMETVICAKKDCCKTVELTAAKIALNDRPTLLVMLRDITLQKRKDQIKGSIVRDVTHTLKSPIAMVRMANDMLETAIKNSDIGQIKKAQYIISRNCIRLENYVKDILDMLSAAARPQTKAGQERFSLNGLVLDELKEEELDIKTARVRIETRLDPKDPQIFSSRNELKIVLHNIVSNTLKFSPGGKAKITTRQKKSGEIIISIADTGIGIKKENLGKVFDSFYKEDHFFKGTGIGLATSKEIIERLNGKITVSSPGKNKGATVRITLPKE
ncbi:MAG: PAS domain S-box protein [Candidatus Margulisbacteria bacterium]|nr:PAS domain S-box protein [Candidatus Margulisiibacteriota bacterium]